MMENKYTAPVATTVEAENEEIKVTDGDRRRRIIFDKFADNLDLLIANGVLKDFKKTYERTYICPICLRHFSYEALNQKVENPLTLEDAPPKSLGGKANVLTCKDCNNTAGTEIDSHLAAHLKALDNSQFLPNTEFKANLEKNGITVQGIVRIGKDGVATVKHNIKNNHPQKLPAYMEGVKAKEIVNLTFAKPLANPDKFQIALLKTGYLMTFAKYGYAFLLSEPYIGIRNQLLNPKDVIYPMDFWFLLPVPKENLGVPFITEKRLEAIMPLFVLKTDKIERTFGAIIPLTSIPIEVTITELRRRFKENGSFEVSMDGMEGADYLMDIDAIQHMLGWIDRKKV